MKKQQTHRVGWIALLAIGCGGTTGDDPSGGDDGLVGGSTIGGQTGSESFGCLVSSEAPLARDESSPLGFSADALLAGAAGERAMSFTWEEQGMAVGETPITLTLTYEGGPISFVDREWRSDGSPGEEGPEPEIGVDCGDVVEIEMELDFATDDGGFDERWTVSLRATAADAAEIVHEIDLETLTGSYTPSIDTTEFDAIRGTLNIQIDADGISGSIGGDGQGVSGDPNDPNSAAFSMGFSIGSFGGPSL